MPFSRFLHREYAVLIGLSASYSPPMGRFLRITHPSATISSSPCGNKEIVLLACLRHAASVHPEPGSNSQKNSYHFLKDKKFKNAANCQSASLFHTAPAFYQKPQPLVKHPPNRSHPQPVVRFNCRFCHRKQYSLQNPPGNKPPHH